MPPQLSILLEDGPCLAVLKPAGIATQAPPGIDSAESRVKSLLAARDGSFVEDVYLAVLHRLDRPVSGVLLFATHRRAARRISEQFERRQVRKVYWACTAGCPLPSAGRWQDHLKKIYGKPRTEVVPPDDPAGRLAVLDYRTLGTTSHGAWLEVQLETGRTHQVRIQAASRGVPVLGDAFYGCQIPFGAQHADERLRAIALHGRSLAFRHPVTRQEIEIVAPLPADWAELGLTDVPSL